MTVSLDTNVIVRLFVNEDAAQSAAARDCLERYSVIRLGNVALLESIYILAERYRLGRKATVKYMQQLFQHPKISYDQALFDPALRHYLAHPKLSIEDCCAAVQATLDGAVPLLTFDQKLANQLQHSELLKV